MKINTPLRRSFAAGLAALALAAATGCSAINPQATTFEYSASDGVQGEAGSVQLTNILIVTAAEDQPGRFLGTLVNHSDQDQTVSIEVNGQTVSWTVPAGESLRLEDDENAQIIDPTGTIPGELADAVVTADGVTTDLEITVLSGTLEEYRQFVPGGQGDEVTDHLYDFEGPYAPDEDGGHGH